MKNHMLIVSAVLAGILFAPALTVAEDRNSGQLLSQVPGQAPDRVPGQVPGQAPDRVPGQPSDQYIQ